MHSSDPKHHHHHKIFAKEKKRTLLGKILGQILRSEYKEHTLRFGVFDSAQQEGKGMDGIPGGRSPPARRPTKTWPRTAPLALWSPLGKKGPGERERERGEGVERRKKKQGATRLAWIRNQTVLPSLSFSFSFLPFL